MNIYLIGMMGSGKSVTGKALADMMKLKFVDLDSVLAEKTGSSISEIFESKGETHFRNLEAQILDKTVSQENHAVIATGGGIVVRPENVRIMKETGRVVYLKTGMECLKERLGKGPGRPLLKGDPQKNLLEIFEKRKILYEQTADASVETDHKTAEAVAKEIVSWLKKNQDKS